MTSYCRRPGSRPTLVRYGKAVPSGQRGSLQDFRVYKGTPSGLRAGAALNTLFAFCLLFGAVRSDTLVDGSRSQQTSLTTRCGQKFVARLRLRDGPYNGDHQISYPFGGNQISSKFEGISKKICIVCFGVIQMWSPFSSGSLRGLLPQLITRLTLLRGRKLIVGKLTIYNHGMIFQLVVNLMYTPSKPQQIAPGGYVG